MSITSDALAVRRADTQARLWRLWPRLVPYTCAAAWVVLLALLWRFEAPSLLHTIIASLSVLVIGIGLIEIAARAGYITSRNAWLIALLLKLTLSFIITSYLWAEPLSKLGWLRVPAVVPGVQDSNLYDYQALQAAQHGFLAEYLNFTWQSFGVVTYLALIYRFFGVSVWYVSMFNTLFSLLGLLALTATLVNIDPAHKRQWQWLRFVMLIPYVAYYDATPAKEPMTTGLFYFTLLFIVRAITRKGSLSKNMLLAFVGLAPLTLVRPNVALLLLLVNLLVIVFSLGFRRGMTILVVAVGLVLALIAASGNWTRVVYTYFNLPAQLDVLKRFWEEREAAGDHPLKLLIGNLLLPRSLASLVLLSPVRALVWFFLPYPIIVPDWATLLNLRQLLRTDPVSVVLFGADLPALLSTWILIFASPFIAAAVFAKRTWQSPGFKLVLLNLFSILLIISNLQFIMGRRYRTLLEPLIMAVALWGGVHGRPAKYQVAFYAVLIGGMILVEIIAAG